MWGGGGRGLASPVFPLSWLENPPMKGGMQWKRIVLGMGGGVVLPPSTGPCLKRTKIQVLTQQPLPLNKVPPRLFKSMFYDLMVVLCFLKTR